MNLRRGFSLVEMLVAITILGIFLLGLAKANYVIARRFYAMSGGGARDAEIASQVDEFAALPFDSVASRAGTTTFSALPWAFTRKVTVVATAANIDSVMIIFTPTNTAFKGDTEVLVRSKPTSNPLKKH